MGRDELYHWNRCLIVIHSKNKMDFPTIFWQNLLKGPKWAFSAQYLSLYSWHLRADSRFAPSQWGTSLQSNSVSHWLGANLLSALHLFNTTLCAPPKVPSELTCRVVNVVTPRVQKPLSVLKFNSSWNSTLYKTVSLNEWIRYFVRNFKGCLWNSKQNILSIHWKMCILFADGNLTALGFKSSLVFFKRPQPKLPEVYEAGK